VNLLVQPAGSMAISGARLMLIRLCERNLIESLLSALATKEKMLFPLGVIDTRDNASISDNTQVAQAHSQ